MLEYKNFCLAMEAHRDREVSWDKNRDRIEVLADENSVVVVKEVD